MGQMRKMTEKELDALIRKKLFSPEPSKKWTGPGWPSERGWLTIALFVQTAGLVALMAWKSDLRSDEFFKAIANAIIVTGWIGFAVGQRQSTQDREQVSRAIDTLHEQAKSLPLAPTATTATKAANEVADAAADKADEIEGSR